MGEQVAARLWGHSSVGRAPALQAGGREFESLSLHCKRESSFTVVRLYLENHIQKFVFSKESTS